MADVHGMLDYDCSVRQATTMYKGQVRRYTELPFLVDMLVHRSITLVSPWSWADTNDSHFLRVYQELSGYRSLLALCFTSEEETYHHWHVFAGRPSGICIEFTTGFLFGWDDYGVNVVQVSYRNMETLEANPPVLHMLPHIKRFAYRREREIRLLWASEKETVPVKRFPLNLRDIHAIHTSPWLPEAVHHSVKDMLRAIPGCGKLRVRRTTFLDSTRWKRFGEIGTFPQAPSSRIDVAYPSAFEGRESLADPQAELDL